VVRSSLVKQVVDDLDAYVARLEAKGVNILKREEDQTGKFATILDPNGTKLEFWQPPAK
jgi:predicted enzyme related to lactoylglutathione lyase